MSRAVQCARFQRLAAVAASFFAIFLIAACASSTPAKPLNAALNSAQTLERRAAQAYAQGDLPSADAAYASAALVYESLAMAQPLARARLNQARVLAEALQTPRAVQLVDAVLAQPDLGMLGAETLAVAYGRAAALQLSLGEPTKAQSHWQSALAACANTCAAQSALQVLRARLDLALGNAAAAVQSASAALSSNAAGGQSSSNPEQANALRVRAQAYAALGQPANSLSDASAALALDQQAGAANKVVSDLDLLASAHQALGDNAQAQRYTQLAQSARAALLALQNGAP